MRPTAYRRNARGPRDRQAFEGVRLQAGALFAAGHSQAEVAHQLGVARQTSAAGTPNGARAGWRRCAAPAPPGPGPRLSETQLHLID
jgi:transposase